MKAYFKYSTDNWTLVPMATGKNDGFNSAIDKPVLSSITVNRPGFMLLNSGLAGEGGWTKGSTTWHFTKIVLVDDSVDGTDLDSDIDAVKKYWMGKVVEIVPGELSSQLICEQYHGQLWREVFDEDDNVLTIDGDDEFKIASFPEGIDGNSQIQLTDASGNAVTFSADEHNGRGCRITARTKENVKCVVASNADISSNIGGYGENYALLDDGYVEASPGMSWINQNKNTKAEVAATATMYVTVPRMPCKVNTISIQFASYETYHNYAGYTYVDNPYLEIYDRDASAWVRLRTWTWQEAGQRTNFKFSVDTEDFDKYWDETTGKVKFQFYTGSARKDSDLKWYNLMAVYQFKIWVYCYGEADPKEYIITDTANDDELTLSIDAGVYDLFVNRHSIGDKVEILAHNEEWLEDTVINYAVDINAINAPTSAAPAFSKKRFKPIGQDMRDINELEEWYCYLTQSTTSGKPDINFVDRSTPTSSGFTIDPSCIVTNKGNILPKYNCLDKVREVLITNGTDTGTSGAEAVSNYPRLTATHKDMPAAYLASMATAILNQRGAVSDDYELTIDKVWNGAAYVAITDLDEDDLMAGLTVDIDAGNARGSGTTPIDVDDVIIREMKILPSMDAVALKLGFADNSHKSKQEKMFELIARTRYEAGSTV